MSGRRMLGPAAAAATATPVAAAVLTTTAVRFALTAAVELGAGDAVATAAGWTGLPPAPEDAAGRAVLPTGRRGRGLLGRGPDDLPAEPGVRRSP